MGEVYRARDSRLGREVALKVLPASLAKDEDRLSRFEHEARAAGALNHPNVLSLFDVGRHDGSPFLVSELLEGSSLRTVLSGSGLPQRKALDYAVQIARGLAAAHDKGILHRDLKPENLFVGKDGRAKILDFGLAKLTRPADGFRAETDAPTVTSPTTPGTVLGTVGYMSPEQVQGLSSDVRSDIFSFGAVLYEMLSGRRAFKGPTAIETMNAILKEDPPDLSGTTLPLPPALERIVRRCLEKNPDERFRSAHDVAFALEALSGSGVGMPATASVGRPRWSLRAGLALALFGLPALGFLLGQSRRSSVIPEFQRLTFRRGAMWSARFTTDGRTVVYGARWDGHPFKVFSTRAEGPETLALPLPDADVLAVSSHGELALALNRPYLVYLTSSLATLATVPLGGGEAREVARDVQSADYSPDGAQLAIVRSAAGRQRLEFPIGKVLYETAAGLAGVRVSPDGKRLALWEGTGDGAHLLLFDPAGTRTALGEEKHSATTLAWSPRGDELWFGSGGGDGAVLKAVDLQGRTRSIMALPGLAHIQDVSRDGRVLMIASQLRSGVRCQLPGEGVERDFPLFAPTPTGGLGLSGDGKSLLFSDRGAMGKAWTYVRKTDSSSGPVRLGPGAALALSPDGRSAIAASDSGGHVLLPVGVGESRALDGHLRNCRFYAQWFPDGRRVLLNCREGDRGARAYAQPVQGGQSPPFTPEGTECAVLSPDGHEAACVDLDGKGWIYPIADGPPRPIAGLESGEFPLQWAVDGKSLLVTASLLQLPRLIHRLELGSGRRSLWKELLPADTAGMVRLDPYVTPDGGTYAYIYERILSDLYVVNGLR